MVSITTITVTKSCHYTLLYTLMSVSQTEHRPNTTTLLDVGTLLSVMSLIDDRPVHVYDCGLCECCC